MQDRTGYLIHAIRALLRTRVEDTLRPMGLTPAQFGLLRYIGEHPDLSAAELARRSLVKPQSSHELVSQLERAGLITRREHPRIGRVLQISVTSAGSTLIERCLPQLATVEDQMLAGFTPRERAQLSALLQRAFQNLDVGEGGERTAG